MQFETIIYEKKDNVAWITLNRPEKYNAQNQTLRSEVVAALDDAKDDDEVRVIVLTGAGDKAFSAGADISNFVDWTTISVITTNKGEKKAREMIFTGDPISAEEALRIGLVNKVVPPDKLRETVDELIKKLKSKSPAILKFAKLAVNKSLDT